MASLQDSLLQKPVELSFGTSGLRGLVTDMTDLECYINTRGFLDFLRQHDALQDGETVYIAGDLRESTPRILAAVTQAIADSGQQVVYCGLVPTPTVAFFALQNSGPCIMVTGSHIPADRNGIKFYKRTGEVLKEDESAIKDSVSKVRTRIYAEDVETAAFGVAGMLNTQPTLPAQTTAAQKLYLERYVSAFGADALAGTSIVFYQHSSVGRDLLVDLLQRLGATVTPVGRSDVFVPIDSENVTPNDQRYFEQLATENPGAFAIVSTDGDSDRPFIVDATGVFHRGDVLGAVVADYLGADTAAFPVSSSDAVDAFLAQKAVPFVHTKIGSPYVVSAMAEAERGGFRQVVGWEVNGGFLLGTTVQAEKGVLEPLPTRDAILPIIVALVAARGTGKTVADLFAALPARYTQAGLIDNFPPEVSVAIVQHFTDGNEQTLAELGQYFSEADGFSTVAEINTLDGIRIIFQNGDIAHLRPSGNAPQLRVYSVANSQERADEIVALAITEPSGILRRLQSKFGTV